MKFKNILQKGEHVAEQPQQVCIVAQKKESRVCIALACTQSKARPF